MVRCAPSSGKPVEKWSKFDWKADCPKSAVGKTTHARVISNARYLVIAVFPDQKTYVSNDNDCSRIRTVRSEYRPDGDRWRIASITPPAGRPCRGGRNGRSGQRVHHPTQISCRCCGRRPRAASHSGCDRNCMLIRVHPYVGLHLHGNRRSGSRHPGTPQTGGRLRTAPRHAGRSAERP